MKIKNLRIFSKRKELERKIDAMELIVGRNKLIAPATSSIDEVVATAKKHNVRYAIHGLNEETVEKKQATGPILQKNK